MTTKTDYVPERGDIAWLVLEPRIGHEQSGRRPVIVISRRELAEHTNLVVVCPITSKVKGLPYEIVLKNTKTEGAILPFHVRSADFRSRKIKFIEKAPAAILAKAVKGVQNVIQ
ncbi:MAG TPA: type II toxin-antitoxin system PemK/MazF family toxin [Candidatus Dormibacteraeota bacterium]|nr:type II toxin-antitoxin system PemK/MazF family toxin [Candidatus Dormibacteraeota bacterium]